MTYKIKEIFYSLQGEGYYTGQPAVFCRFSGCNLWNGQENGRPSAMCKFCDTDFRGTDGTHGGNYQTPRELAEKIASLWPMKSKGKPFVVCTGGEPLLQLDGPAVDAFHRAGFEVAVETNGTLEPPPGVDWICVSPKAGSRLVLRRGDELKIVFPQVGLDPTEFEGLDFRHFFIQPMDGPELEPNTRLAVDYCLKNPQWRLSLQTHKYLGID